MRRWKRVETRDGPRFRSSLAPHEAALLKNLAGAMIGLLDDRDSSSPHELETQKKMPISGGGVHRRLGRPVEIGDPDRSTTENVPDVADQPVIVNA